MSTQTKIISGANGTAFLTALTASMESGEKPIGEPWTDGTDTYQLVEVFTSTGYWEGNPDLLSRNFRAKQVSGSGYPTSSNLDSTEWNLFYK